jgi:transcriptional regulator with PAS, ATPase and Fis domain
VGAINRLLDRGANPLEIAEIVGMSLQMVQRYTRRHFERRRTGNLCAAGMESVYAAVKGTDLATSTIETPGRAPGKGYRSRQRAEIVETLRNTENKTAAAKHLGYSREWLRQKIKEYNITDDEWR